MGPGEHPALLIPQVGSLALMAPDPAGSYSDDVLLSFYFLQKASDTKLFFFFFTLFNFAVAFVFFLNQEAGQ